MIEGPDALVERHYSALAASYGTTPDDSLAGRLKLGLLERLLQPSDTALDLGCANGIHLVAAARLCRKAVGVDLSTEMLAAAARTAGAAGVQNVDLVAANADALPFSDEAFDLIYSFSTFPWVTDWNAALNEVARTLRGGGLAVLDFAGRWNLSRRHWDRWYREQGTFGVHALTWPQLLHALSARRLELLEAHGTGVLDQTRYLRGAERLALPALTRRSRAQALDHRLSNMRVLRRFANRWYVVGVKRG